MVDFLDPSVLKGNPFVSEGMKRRAREADQPVQSEVELTDPYKGDWLAETTRSTAANVANDWTTGMEALGRGLVGDQAGAQRAAERYLARQEEARALGPRIQTFDDAAAAGGGAGDYAASLAYQGAALVPDLVSIATGVGAGEVAGRSAARGLVRRSIADAIERRAASTAARDEAVKVATRRAALGAPDGAAAVSAAMNTAEQQATGQARRAALQEAARIAGRTPRVGTNPFQETVSAAGRWAGRAAGTAAGVPRANNGNAELLADPAATQGDAAALLAGDVAGAATGLLPFERFVGQFGKEAAKKVERDAGRFLPRVAKEFGKQGLAEGSQEVVQQATQLASHAYVKQNPELLYNDDAWNQYVASFGAGFFLGGALGGAGEVGRSGARAARGAASRAFQSAQDMFREGVAKYGQRARERARPRPGEEILSEGTATSGAVSGFVRNLRSLGDNVGRMGKNVADKFRGNQDDVQNDDLADNLLGEFQRDGRWQIPDQQREPTQNPVEFKSPMQARLMSYVADDSPIWQDKNTARRVARSLERLFGDRAKTNAVSDTDMGVYDWLVNSGSVSRRAMTAMKGIGHIYAGLDKQTTALENGAGGEAQNTAMADAMRSALDAHRATAADRDAAMADRGEDESARALEAEGDAVNATLSERSGPDAASPLRDQVANLRRSVIAANQRVQSAKTDEARQHLIETERAPLDRQMKQAAAALREKLLGPKGDPRGQDPLKYQYGRNVFDENKKAGNFDTKIREPGRVELVEQGKFVKRDGTSEPRRLGLSLDSLMLQELQENSADYQNLETSPERYKAAFMRVVGDVLQAGIRIKPESLTPGEIKNKDGQFLTRITPRDVAQLRGEIARVHRETKQIAPRTRWTDLEGKQTIDEFEGLQKTPTGTLRERADEDEQAGLAPERHLGEGDFDEGADRVLGPRALPEGRSIGGSFVPTSEAVTDVKLAPSPYESEVNAVRQLRRTQGTTPRDVARAIHEAGVRIGEAELAKQDAAGAINPSRLQRELGRLRDPHSGASRSYFKQAVDGAFDRGAPVEARARTNEMEAVDQKELAKEQRALNTDEQADEVAQGATEASKAEGPHDLAKEAAMLNALAEAAGARTGITVESAGAADPRKGGSYSRGKLRVRINDNLHGAERMEVLLHELGHHLIWNEVAKLVGWDVVGGKSLSLATAISALKVGNPELHGALTKDFDAFRASGKTSKPFHRAQRGAPVSFEDDAVAFHEWMADNVARALSRQKKPVGIVGQFFGKIATALRSAWRKLSGAGAADQYAAAKSVDDWVRSLFDANTEAVREATGAAVPQAVAEASVRAAGVATADATAQPFTVENVGDLISFIKYTVPKEERQILDRIFSRAVATQRLREFWNDKLPDVVPMLDDAKENLENRIALGYLAWQAGAFNNVGPRGTSALVDIRDNALSILGLAGEGDLGQRVLEDIANGTIQHFHDKSKTYSVRELEARARGTTQRALNWLAQEGPVSDALTRFWTSQYGRMRGSGVPAMREIAATLQRPQGATGDEDRGMNVAVRVKLAEFNRRFGAVLKDLTVAEQQRALQALQRQAAPGTPAYDNRSTKVRGAIDAMRALFEEAHAYGAEQHLFGEGKQRRQFYFPVLMDIRAEDARDRLTKLYSKDRYREAIFDRFALPADERTDDAHVRLVARLVDAAAHATADPMGVDDGMIKGVRSQNQRVSQFIYDAGDAADIRDLAALQTKNVDEVFARYFSPLVKAVEFRRRFGRLEGGGEDGEQRFNPRGRLDEMLAEVRKQGGTEEDAKLAENAVKAALGTYGADGSPTLNAISPALAKRFSGAKTKAVIEGGQAYQNTRLLPLALLSSLVDPMGIAVRTGGDFSAAWDGFRAGMRSITNKQDARELLAALEEIGSGDDFLPALAAHPVFDGQENGFARRVNDFVFKWNGMQTWIAATRIMAMEAGHRFLLNHAAADTDQSRRYLAELSLTPEDIQADAEKPGRVVLNDKTRAALNQFVDEAILRPNSLQVPLWHRDPYMGLLSQYKAFGYAIYDQISGRVSREMTHGNYRVMLAALSYAPIVVMAELLRELIQYGVGGNPQRKEWGPGDYTALAVDRSGLLGPKASILGDLKGDVSRRSVPGSSQLGPAFGQAGDVLGGRRDPGKEFESALPGSAAYRHWNDAPAAQEQTTDKAST